MVNRFIYVYYGFFFVLSVKLWILEGKGVRVIKIVLKRMWGVCGRGLGEYGRDIGG